MFCIPSSHMQCVATDAQCLLVISASAKLSALHELRPHSVNVLRVHGILLSKSIKTK